MLTPSAPPMITQLMIAPPLWSPCVSTMAMREPPGVVYHARAVGSVLSVALSVAAGCGRRGTYPLHRIQPGGALVEQAGRHVDPVDGAAGAEGHGAHGLARGQPCAVVREDGGPLGL